MRVRNDMFMSTAVGVRDETGRLSLEDGCIVFRSDDGKTVMNTLWQASHAPDLSVPDRVGVKSLLSGQTVWTGEAVVISGKQPGPAGAQKNRNADPARWAEVADDVGAPCPAPYISVEGAQSETDAREAAIEQRVDQLMRSRDMKRGEARAEAIRIIARSSELKALRDTVLLPRTDIVSMVFGPRDRDFTYDPFNGAPLTVVGVDEGAIRALIPDALQASVTFEAVPRSRASIDADAAAMAARLGPSAEVYGDHMDGSLTLHSIDLRELSDFYIAGGTLPDDMRVYLPEVPSRAGRPYGSAEDFHSSRAALREDPNYGAVKRAVSDVLSVQNGYMADSHRLDETVRRLFGFGFKDAAEIKRLESLGYGPVTAITRHDSPNRPLLLAALADTVVVADVADIEIGREAEDGYRSTVRFTVRDALKGNAEAGQTILIRMQGGENKEGHVVRGPGEPNLLPLLDDTIAGDGGPVLLMLQRGDDGGLHLMSDYGQAGYFLSQGTQDDPRFRYLSWESDATVAEIRERMRAVLPDAK